MSNNFIAYKRFYIFIICTLLLCACTPNLNWREIQNNNYKLMFPAKPAQTQKDIIIDNQKYKLYIQASNIDIALFGLAYIEVLDYNTLEILPNKLQKQWCNPLGGKLYLISKDKQIFECNLENKTMLSSWVTTGNRIYQLSIIFDVSNKALISEEDIKFFFDSFIGKN